MELEGIGAVGRAVPTRNFPPSPALTPAPDGSTTARGVFSKTAALFTAAAMGDLSSVLLILERG
jgi:hypothetical protein